ncbi:hypothetical protein BDA99DRAFT_585276 [Phascolomyces articulosus]|uniref:Zincin n=1 Tax=Phascolomyces articulosus TaxID=60185 RepID=A0AAD5JVU8_9FUNG|nr:hypothetical protein BDA99DRAFT_585276 [Phascolomyces articulosus]
MLGLFVNASPVPATISININNNVTECQTQACVDAAKAVKDYIDFNADPCTDFYQYAYVGTFDTVNDENIDIIGDILQGTYDDLITNSKKSKENFHDIGGNDENNDQSDIDKQNFHELQDYYNSCMDTVNIDALGATPVYPMVAKLLKTFATYSDSDNTETKFGTKHTDLLTDALIELYHHGIESVISIVIDADGKHPDENSIQISQPSLILPSKEYYEQKDTLETYRTGLVEILISMIGKNDDTLDVPVKQLQQQKAKESNIQLLSKEQIQDMVDRAVKFEAKLASITLKEEQMQDPVKLYNPTSLAEIQENYSFINWKKLLEAFITDETLIPNTLIVTTPSYFTDLTHWFLSIDNDGQQSGVSLQTMKEYFMIKILKTWLYALDTDTRQQWRHTWAKISSGTFELSPRKRTCINNVVGSFGDMIGHYFAMRRFAGEEEERKQVDDFVTKIHNVWLDRLDDVDWLDPETRQAAIEKVGKIKHKIAYSIASPDVRSPASLRDHYKPIKIIKKSFFANEISFMKWSTKRAWSKVGKPVDKEEWAMSPSDVNAYYSRSSNEIAVPAGILQKPFYNYEAPWYLNYGSIGAIIGHELTHAFDSAGRMYDGTGKLENWWSPETAKHFEGQSDCFVKQYNDFIVEGPNGRFVNVNGQLTLAENLADNGGIAASYQAFQKIWSEPQLSGQQHAKLPGIDLSPEELFFTSFARTWCSATRPEALVEAVYTDVHSPERYRVIGTVQNSVDFAKVFKCPQGSPMNPEKKCVIW